MKRSSVNVVAIVQRQREVVRALSGAVLDTDISAPEWSFLRAALSAAEQALSSVEALEYHAAQVRDAAREAREAGRMFP